MMGPVHENSHAGFIFWFSKKVRAPNSYDEAIARFWGKDYLSKYIISLVASLTMSHAIGNSYCFENGECDSVFRKQTKFNRICIKTVRLPKILPETNHNDQIENRSCGDGMQRGSKVQDVYQVLTKEPGISHFRNRGRLRLSGNIAGSKTPTRFGWNSI